MTIIIATREFIATDSRLVDDNNPLTVGKIFKKRGGGLFATAGDSRRTHAFEKALKSGKAPPDLEILEDENFEAVLLTPKGELHVFDSNFAGFQVAEPWVVCGSGHLVAKSWMINGADVVTAIRRVIQVDKNCGYPIVVVPLKGKPQIIQEE